MVQATAYYLPQRLTEAIVTLALILLRLRGVRRIRTWRYVAVTSAQKCHVAKRNGQILRTPRKRHKTSANVTMASVSRRGM